MPRKYYDIDRLLKDWVFHAGVPLVRRISGRDGRELLQMRVDMGLLQLETTGRPDGQQPHGFANYYDYLVAAAFEEGNQFQLDVPRCVEIDREFYQYYHRRICWLTLKEYERAMADAEHSLRLMDFTSANADDHDWVLMHEQYRPFVMFHRIQAHVLMALEASKAPLAVERLDFGVQELRKTLRRRDANQHDPELREPDKDEHSHSFVEKLIELRASIVEQYRIGRTLAEQLADAIASEQYERAAKIRDRLQKKRAK